MNLETEKRYKGDDELIEALEKLYERSNPKAQRIITQNINLTKPFIGREEELEKIQQILDEHSSVFLHGIGGIGKSSIALKYLCEHKDEYDITVRVNYQDSLSGSLMTHLKISNYEPYGKDEQERFEYYYRVLQGLCTKRTLLLIDGFDASSDQNLEDIRKLNCHTIITTRNQYGKIYPDSVVNVGIDKHVENLKKIFLENGPKNYEKTEESDRKIEQIVTAVGGHPLAIELLAKQLKASRLISLDDMITRLKDAGIDTGLTTNFLYEKDGEIRQDVAFGHIKAIFDFTKMEEEEIDLLKVLSYVPQSGIEIATLLNWLGYEGEGGISAINDLIDAGWVSEEEDQQKIWLHSVISDVHIKNWMSR
jgi:hypothetical protein